MNGVGHGEADRQPIKAHKAGAIIGLVAEVGQTVTKCSAQVALGVEHAKFVLNSQGRDR